MRKVLLFLYEDMADFEITFACHRLGVDGSVEILPVAYQDEIVTSACGIRYQPRMTVEKALPLPEVRGLIIPGGRPGEIRDGILQLIGKIDRAGGMLAAIGWGPRFLAQAGVLQGKRFTTSADPEHFQETGETDPFPWETFKDNNVTIHEHLITAKGNCFVDFGIAVCDYFGIYSSRMEMESVRRKFKGLDEALG